jgi:hypothetical protein
MNSCYVKTLQEPSVQPCGLWAFEFVGTLRHEPEIKLCGKQMLMTKPRVLTSMIWWYNVDLALSHIMVKISDEFLLKIKLDKFLNGHITYQRHMSISKYKPSTYVWLWPIEFCQIVVTLGRIFSCFHDWDHEHPHIHANFHMGSYVKHAIHPPKINTPKYKNISLLVFL